MRRRIEISYEWWRSDRAPIDPYFESQLEAEALDRVKEMQAEGYIAGEMNASLEIPVLWGKDAVIEFSGWWDVKELKPEEEE